MKEGLKNCKLMASGSSFNDEEDQSGTAVINRPKISPKEPSMYLVLLHNDDYTPMDFVVKILRDIFHINEQKAERIMLDVHEKGIGRCGVYPYEVAEMKIALVLENAKQLEYPLKCTMEKDA